MKRSALFIAGTALALGMAHAQADDISAGEKIYTDACMQCHGPAGRGAGSFPSVNGRDADYIVKRLEQYRAGERVGSNTALMAPAARDLSDEDIANLAAYISTEFE